jgi:hypothetical protein
MAWMRELFSNTGRGDVSRQEKRPQRIPIFCSRHERFARERLELGVGNNALGAVAAIACGNCGQ